MLSLCRLCAAVCGSERLSLQGNVSNGVLVFAAARTAFLELCRNKIRNKLSLYSGDLWVLFKQAHNDLRKDIEM